MAEPRVLVTGGTGFVGAAVRARFAATDRPVRLAVRRPVSDLAATEEAVTLGPIEAVEDWGSTVAGIDAVVHLAARVHVMGPQDDAAYAAVNTVATRRLAAQAAAAGVRRLVFLSTVKVLGEATEADVPLTDDSPPAPADAYARSKLAAEDALSAIGDLETVVLRPPLVYGPGVGANFAALMRLAAGPLPLPFARIRNRRDLIHVDNLASAIEVALAAPEVAGGRFLVCDGVALSTGDLIRQLRAGQGRSARLFAVPNGTWPLMRRLPLAGPRIARLTESLAVDAGGFRRATGWVPPIDAIDALARLMSPTTSPHAK